MFLFQQLPVPEIQITHDSSGHCINSTQCFSPDGQWIVYDSRNKDAQLAGNAEIRMVNISTQKDVLLYRTSGQTEYGPGVGAATFSPDGKKVLFLGGIQNASEANPYSFTRRTGIAVELAYPLVPVWMDARDITAPFTPGALRGGTHAHTWSGDGQWISFTYNDYILSEQAKTDSSIIDTRTVGVMFAQPVQVKNADGVENKNGEMYSVLITRVVKHPVPGTDDISRAFDECWIGENGYIKPNGRRQQRAIAFQGELVDKEGNKKTEIFVADIPDPLLPEDGEAQAGTLTTLPAVPAAIQQRRISFTANGVSATPRHWLRSTSDGSLIGFLAADKNGVVQLWGISPNGGESVQLTHLTYSIEGPFNFSPDDRWVAYAAAGEVHITRVSNGETRQLTSASNTRSGVVGGINWSPQGDLLCYNRYENGYLQIFAVKVEQM